MAGCTALGAACATASEPNDALLLAATSVGFLFSRVVLLPRIDQARLRAEANDVQAAAQFRRLHRASTILNAFQLVAVTVALIGLAG